GGMGIVYEARQISLSRRVALKVVPFAAALGFRSLARFKQESLAAAQLDPPPICSLYGVGVDRGVYYYAMRYIEGQSLAQLIAAMKRGGENDRVEEVENSMGSRNDDECRAGKAERGMGYEITLDAAHSNSALRIPVSLNPKSEIPDSKS